MAFYRLRHSGQPMWFAGRAPRGLEPIEDAPVVATAEPKPVAKPKPKPRPKDEG